jgi:hypothetical protein
MTTWQTIKDSNWTIRKVKNGNNYIEATFTTYNNWLLWNPTFIDIRINEKEYHFLTKELAEKNQGKLNKILEFIK